MFLLNGKALAIDTPFEYEGVRYPANWLRLSSAGERATLGITEVAVDPRPNDQFYWVTDNGDGTYIATPKDLDVLKADMVGQVKTTAGTLLAASDWKVVRASEGVKPVDDATLTARAGIRQRSDEHEAAITACTTVEELAALQLNWTFEE